jgi:hypothetical protein
MGLASPNTAKGEPAMKSSDVQIGATYLVRVADNLVPVKLVREHPSGGWEGVSEKTGKTIRIKSAQRLRKRLADGANHAAHGATTAEKPTKEAKADAQRHTGERNATGGDVGHEPKRLSILDAAIKVLEERDPADGPLSCTQMVERMAAKGYWSPARGGRTPANTLYSAVLREINIKGEDSRFDKVERGRFSLSLKR